MYLKVPHCHIFSHFFNILSLIGPRKGNTSDSWQIHQSQIRTVLTVNSQKNWFRNNTYYKLIWTFVFSCNFISELFDHGFNFFEVSVFDVFVIIKNLNKKRNKSNTAHGFMSSFPASWTNRISKGLLVTTPSPLGRKSSPTMDSSKELFPLLWVPKTAIRGKFMNSWSPTSRSSSIICELALLYRYQFTKVVEQRSFQ